MKFQCGKCGKNYLVDNTETMESSLTIPCNSCGNCFSIDSNLAFSSASGDSKIICENCGQLINEKIKACPSCNLVLNKQNEAERIDNKVYEKVQIQDGKVLHNNKEQTGKKGRKGLLVVLLLLLLLLAGAAFWFLNTQQHGLKGTPLEPIAQQISTLSGREETQVVVMMNGQTYYADKLEHDGTIVRITTKNGSVVEVAKKDVLDIATAVVEN